LPFAWRHLCNDQTTGAGDPSQIEAIAMDMSPAYVKGATEYFPGAGIVFDKFHVVVLAGAALDQVRYFDTRLTSIGV
jgi:transposase